MQNFHDLDHELDEDMVMEAGAPSPPSSRKARPALAWRMRQWIDANTFRPTWLAERWRHPFAAYAAVVGLQVAVTLITVVLVRIFPTFSFPEALVILVVALAALTWGAGPSLTATLAGTVFLEIVVLPNMPSGGVRRVGDVVEIAIIVAVGAIISAAASGTEGARRRAMRAYARSHAREVALRAMNRRMDEFLSLTSHELRSPLASIRMAVQLAERRLRRLSPHGEGDLGESVEAILDVLALAGHEVDRQNHLVGDLLDVGRIRSGTLEFFDRPCDLVTIVGDATAAQRLAWPERTIELDNAMDSAPLRADAHRIEQVVTNYLTNALKYSGEDAPVAVSLRQEGSWARVEVRDRGPGLTREQQERIWERFHRVPGIQQQSGQGPGLGLGLYICRTIVEHSGGTLGVESRPGDGSTFWFTLPLSPAAD